MHELKEYWEILKKADPQVVVLLATGLGVVATAGITSDWRLDPVQAGKAGLYVLAIGSVAILVAKAITDKLIKLVLSWFLALSVMVTFIVFATSAFVPGWSPFAPVPCLLNWQERCGDVLDRQAARLNTPPPEVKAVSAPLPPSVAKDVQPGNYQVDVQFAGVIRREDVIMLSKSLHESGWKMDAQVVARGGERTPAASGYNEVRYGAEQDYDAALLLAQQVQGKNLTGKAIAALRNPGVKSGNLEIWLSY